MHSAAPGLAARTPTTLLSGPGVDGTHRARVPHPRSSAAPWPPTLLPCPLPQGHPPRWLPVGPLLTTTCFTTPPPPTQSFLPTANSTPLLDWTLPNSKLLPR